MLMFCGLRSSVERLMLGFGSWMLETSQSCNVGYTGNFDFKTLMLDLSAKR